MPYSLALASQTMSNATFSSLITSHVKGPWAQLRYPSRARSRALRLLEHFGDFPVTAEALATKFSTEALKSARDAWSLQNSSMNRYIAVLDSMDFKVCYLPVHKDSRVKSLTSEQLKRLDARVRADTDLDCQAFYAFLRDTGCRGLTEFNRIQPQDIDWHNARVVLRSWKGGKKFGEAMQRTVPLSDVALNALAWLANGPKVTETRWRAFWQRVRLDASNVPYDLRHTFCTRLLDAGEPDSVVMAIMGHTNIAQTLHYKHLRPSALDSARRSIQLE